MTANTKRLTANKHWQQVSTGNVTLAGCNTLATYHIYVGADAPNEDSDYLSDTLQQPTPYDFDTSVWVKLNVTNQVDEADLIALGDLAQSVVSNEPKAIPPTPQEPLPVVLPTFDKLINCTYDNGILNIIDRNVPYADYYAISLRHRSVRLTAQSGLTRILFSRATQFETRDVFDKDCVGFGFSGYGSEGVFDDLDNNRQTTDMIVTAGDELIVTMQEGVINVSNLTQGTNCTSPLLADYTQITALAIANYDKNKIPAVLNQEY